MKQIQYIASIALASLFTVSLCGCSEKEEMTNADDERGIAIEGIAVSMEGMSGEMKTSTRGTQSGFSVNTDSDPTHTALTTRGSSNWKMDLTMYNGTANTAYTSGTFTGATYKTDGSSMWAPSEQKYFPNYKKPQAEAVIYPTAKNSEIAKNQSQANGDNLLAQDILFKEKGEIDVAHIPDITVKHKHSMLDFVIKDVVRNDISEVKILVGNDEYSPYKVTTETTGTGDIEYMVILPETTSTSPVVQITTQQETSGGTINSITYKQTIGIISASKTTLGSNKCYCFTLQGAQLTISPVTVLNWATGASLPGEYIAVTAYPTFKAGTGDAGKTYYFYYDSKLKENGKPKLQKITFNKNSECTIKPDGRILNYIYKDTEVEPIEKSSTAGNMTPKNGTNGKEVTVLLGQMIIDLQDKMPTN